ncbi:hypothetical protein PFUGPA_03431 [Plasmodium falciparum Palo Alto/Uganda]|uniref:RRM domain-containing protein n=2 Tax=Plasmodium falciparum TaxID=5833 RepID=W4IYD5_PLAFP|nr:hypothetical protein PFUGPA_03431 [Plasmodium falciparum Palo Alto/Uganda]ETW59809.1 hypothetical protein PFMC_04271 [Plasmodium falciparum CAMP/Malaysia]
MSNNTTTHNINSINNVNNNDNINNDALNNPNDYPDKNTNFTNAHFKPSSYVNGAGKNMDSAGNIIPNINNNIQYHMPIPNNMPYGVNPNYNIHNNKMINNPKNMYNAPYPLNMNTIPINSYGGAEKFTHSVRIPIYPTPQNMLYNTMNYMNSKAYIKHLKYNKVIPTDPTIPPNETLYIKNLNDRVKTDEMKKNLKDLFNTYGEIKDLIVMKSFWRKGQAWVVYDDKECATKALNALQGYVLFGKIMQINFSHNKSDIHAKRDGTFVERSKEPKKPKKILEREQKQKEIFEQMHKNYLEMQKNNFNMLNGNKEINKPEIIDLSQMDKQTLIAKAQAKANEDKNKKNEELPNNNIFSSYYQMNNIAPVQNYPVVMPYKILFVENVVENVDTQAFNDLFKNYAGFVEARIIPQRNVAFVDFTDETTATFAMKAVQNYELQGSKLKISYAKR